MKNEIGVEMCCVVLTPILPPLHRLLPILNLLMHLLLPTNRLLAMLVKVNIIDARPLIILLSLLIVIHDVFDHEEEFYGADHYGLDWGGRGSGEEGDGAVVGPDALAVELGGDVHEAFHFSLFVEVDG